MYANPPTFRCSLRSIKQLTFPLEAAGIGPLNTMYNLTQLQAAETGMSNEFYLNNLIHPIVVTVFFDIEYAGNRPLQIWAMYVTSEEGLLLQQIQDPKSGSIVYERLGIFAVGYMPTFIRRDQLRRLQLLNTMASKSSYLWRLLCLFRDISGQPKSHSTPGRNRTSLLVIKSGCNSVLY